jgi:hypothetical protein
MWAREGSFLIGAVRLRPIPVSAWVAKSQSTPVSCTLSTGATSLTPGTEKINDNFQGETSPGKLDFFWSWSVALYFAVIRSRSCIKEECAGNCCWSSYSTNSRWNLIFVYVANYEYKFNYSPVHYL